MRSRFLNETRLHEALSISGFALTYQSSTKDLHYARRTSISDIFEKIWVKVAGKDFDSVSARAGISIIVGGNATVDMVEAEYLASLGGSSGRGYHKLLSADDAAAWGSKLVGEGSRTCTAVNARCVEKLTQRTQSLRSIASQYAREWRSNVPSVVRDAMFAKCTADQQSTARSFARKFMLIGHADEHYVTALSTMLANSLIVEGRQLELRDPTTSTDRSQFNIVQCLVDRLLFPNFHTGGERNE